MKKTKDLGAVTAYAYAKNKGFSGTEDDFSELMASYATVAQRAAQSAAEAKASADRAAAILEEIRAEIDEIKTNSEA